MIITDIRIVNFLVVLLFGIPILWNARKSGLKNSFNYINLVRTINKSLKMQGIIGLILTPLALIWNLEGFILNDLLGGTIYNYLIIGIFMYLPALLFLNLMKLLIEKKLKND